VKRDFGQQNVANGRLSISTSSWWWPSWSEKHPPLQSKKCDNICLWYRYCRLAYSRVGSITSNLFNYNYNYNYSSKFFNYITITITLC